jgi:hypothetical protein
MGKEEVLARLREHRSTLIELSVKSLALFGSAARGQARPGSDVDLLVEFSKPVGLFEFIRLKHTLEEILNCDVDLVTPDALRPTMKNDIFREAVDVTP